MNAFALYIIILDVIIAIAPPSTTEPLCNSTTTRYYHQPTAVADSVYIFSWAVSSGSYARTRLVVGGVQCLLEYRTSDQKAALMGVCGSTDASAFSVQDKTLKYQKNGFSFEIQCFYEEDSPLKIKVLPRSSTAIEAFR